MTSTTEHRPLVVLDTSFFVAIEQGRSLRTLPDGLDNAVTVVTLAELHLGVLSTSDPATIVQRLATLVQAQDFDVLGVDEDVAERFVGIVRHARRHGLRVGVQDAWIAAIAAAHGAAVATQDDDFDGLPVEVIKL